MPRTPLNLTRALPALALLALAASAGCAAPDAPRPIRESSTTAAARTGFDDPTAVAADATTTPAAGAAEPLVVVTVFADFQCRFCPEVRLLTDKLLSHWPDVVQVQYRQFPLESIHPLAKAAAIGALAAHRQGGFPCFERTLYATQRAWTRDDVNSFQGRLTELAFGCGLDTARFVDDLADPALRRAVEADVARAQALGVNGTPTVLVDGRRAFLRPMLRQPGEETVTAAVRRELIEARRAIALGGDARTQLRERVISNTGEDQGADWLLDDKRP